MPDQQIFCNTPWFEAHVYWDGGLGVCCQERHRLYPHTDARYNIRNMSLLQWCGSKPVQQFRAGMLGSEPLSACTRCYEEESAHGVSRRLRANLKSVIYTRQAFEHSWQQSPHRDRFVPGSDQTPVDLHIDLGNFCNLTCKMCYSGASSRIAQQMVAWGHKDHEKFVGQDWTQDSATWQRFLQELLQLPNLVNLHFMGGETVLTPRFAELLDWLITHNRTDVRISFVTNGTRWRPDIMQRLSQFAAVGVEVSIESVTVHNDYVRQGTDTVQVLANIQRYRHWANGATHTVTLRTVPQALTMSTYHTLLTWARDQQLTIKANICMRPTFMRVDTLPKAVRDQYLEPYQQLAKALEHVDVVGDFNSSDPNAVDHSIKEQAQLCIGLLTQPVPHDQSQRMVELFAHCRRWDSVGELKFEDFYPELVNRE